MAHRINVTNGRAGIAYAGETPWHGLGTAVGSLQTVEAMLQAAGLDWKVGLEPLFLGNGAEVKAARAILRVDTGVVLGVASRHYQPIQNSQAGEIVDALVTGGGAHVDVAGALDAGERCWMLTRIPGEFEVVKGDAVQPYFLLVWGHDGKHGVAGKLTPIRVVCHNTLTAAGFGEGKKWSQSADVYIRHLGQPTLRIEEARRALGLAKKQTEGTAEAYRTLASTRMTGEGTTRYIADVFPLPVQDDEAEETRKIVAEMLLEASRREIPDETRQRIEEQRAIVAELIESGRGSDLPGVRGTAWGAYNAVAEYVDHVYPVLKSRELSPVRQRSALFGSAASVKRRAMDSALALV